MPRTKSLVREDPREIQIREQIGALKGKLRINDSEISRRTGISRSTIAQLLGSHGNVRDMRLWQLWAILDLDKERKS